MTTNSNTLPYVRVFARPRSEGLQLRFWLAHPCVEEIELAKFLRAYSCIAVDRVVSKENKIPMGIRYTLGAKRKKGGTPLVMLHKANDIVFS
jgi:hypothetical protein